MSIQNRLLSTFLCSARLIMGVCAGLAAGCDGVEDEGAFDVEGDDRLDNKAARIWYQCQTATDQGASRWSYKTSFFNNSAQYVHVLAQKDGNSFEPVMLTKIGTNTWSDNERITVRIEQKSTNDPKTNGTKGIRVDHHTMNWTASSANSWCEVDDRDADGDYCASQGRPQAAYVCDGGGCRCVESGVAPEDPWGNFIIDTLAGGLAGPLRALGSKGLATILAIQPGEHAMFLMAETAQEVTEEGAKVFYTRVLNPAVTKQMNSVREEVVEDLVRMANHLRPDREYLEVPTYFYGHNAKYISLGEAKEFTRRTGREIALLWDREEKKNLVSIGIQHSVTMPKGLASGQHRLIWHTHPVPPVGNTSALPSVADGKVIVTIGQQSSFIIPAETDEFIVKFWSEAL